MTNLISQSQPADSEDPVSGKQEGIPTDPSVLRTLTDLYIASKEHEKKAASTIEDVDRAKRAIETTQTFVFLGFAVMIIMTATLVIIAGTFVYDVTSEKASSYNELKSKIDSLKTETTIHLDDKRI